MENILIIRFGGMGDTAKCAHTVRALRQAYPKLHITVLTKTRYVPVFNRIDNISFLTYSPEGRHKGLAGLVRLRNELHANGYDAIADMQNSLRTKLLRLSLRHTSSSAISIIRRQRKLLTRKYRKVLDPMPQFVERCRETLTALGLDVTVEPTVSTLPSVTTPQVEELYGKKLGVWIGVSTFGHHKGQIYPIPQADKLIGLLTTKADRVFVFGHGEYEVQFAEAMEQRHIGAISVADRLPLATEQELIGSIDVMVTTDSSLLHLASWAGRPVVSVWGATSPLAGHYGFGQAEEYAVQCDLHCRPCSKSGMRACIMGDYRCMTRISPEEIVNKVEAIVRNTITINTNEENDDHESPKGVWQRVVDRVKQGSLW